MKKNSLFIIGLLCFLFAGCSLSNKADGITQGVGTVTIGTGARSIVPIEWSIGDCEYWNVTFHNDLTDIIFKDENLTGDGSTFTIPVGSYEISVEGTFEKEGQTYTVFGKRDESVVVREGENSLVTIYVSLKKSEAGTGTFVYSITTSNAALINAAFEDSIPSGGEGGILLEDVVAGTRGVIVADGEEHYVKIGSVYSFGAYLTKVGTEEKVWLSVTNEKIDDAELMINFEGSEIPSGYYYLSVNYKFNNKTFPVSIPDCLVEIVDEKQTNGSYNDVDFATVITRNIFVSNDTGDRGNGLTPDYKKEFNAAIKWLGDNSTKWTNANLYFNSSADLLEVYVDRLLKSVPGYDVSIPNPTELNSGRAVNVYVDAKKFYTFIDGTINISNDCEVAKPLYFYNDTAAPKATVKINTDADLDIYTMVLQNTEVELSYTKELGAYPEITCNIKQDEAPLFTVDKEPVLTINYAGEVTSENASSVEIILYDSSSGIIDEPEYMALSVLNENKQKIFTSKLGESGIVVASTIPAFNLASTKNKYYIGVDSATVSLATKEAEPFLEGTTFEWYINGTKVESGDSSVSIGTDSISIDLTLNEHILLDSNTVQIIASKDGDYSSASTTFEIADIIRQKFVFFNEADGYGKWETEYNIVSGANIDTHNQLLCYCYDENGNFYVALYDRGNGSSPGTKYYQIDKYEYNKYTKLYETTPVTLWKSSEPDNDADCIIRMASDGKNVYFIKSMSKYNLTYNPYDHKDANTLYYISAENPADPEAVSIKSIPLEDYFEQITAVSACNNKLYVGGMKLKEELDRKYVGFGGTETIDTGTKLRIYEYFVLTYDIYPAGDIDTTSKDVYLSYTNKELVEKFDLDKLSNESPANGSEPWSDKIVSFGGVISDIVAYMDNVYVLISYEAKNSYSLFGFSGGSNYGVNEKRENGGIVFYKENSEIKSIRISGEKNLSGGTGGGETVKMVPGRIIAIKPKELILGDASDNVNRLYETVNLDTEEVTVSEYGYGYRFDSCIDGSGNFIGVSELEYINSDFEGTTRS